MRDWPLLWRCAVVAVPFVATVAAFAQGVMILAMPGVLVSGWFFHRAFLSDL